MPRKITTTIQELRAWCEAGYTREQTAEGLGISYQSLTYRLRKLDPHGTLRWKRPQPPNPQTVTYDDFLQLADQNYTRRQAYHHLNLSTSTGYRLLQRLDPRGTIPWRTPPRTMAQLRRLARDYQSREAAAESMGYHPEYFKSICRRLDPNKEVAWAVDSHTHA